MITTSAKAAALIAGAALIALAGPVAAGKQSVPGASTATVAMTAVPPSSGAKSTFNGGSAIVSSSDPALIATILAQPGAYETTVDGEPATIFDSTYQNVPVRVVVQNGVATAYRR